MAEPFSQDITPITLQSVLSHPLLDGQGKTLSHAFVQLHPEHVLFALRSLQNAILGKGRRARAVTIPMSGVEAVMSTVSELPLYFFSILVFVGAFFLLPFRFCLS